MKTKQTEKTPIQGMREFFDRQDVKALQEVMKRNHPCSLEAQYALREMKRLGDLIGASKYFQNL